MVLGNKTNNQMRYVMTTPSFNDQARIFKALGHPSRLTMAHALLKKERNVGELQALVGADISTVSKHLALLKKAGIVAFRRQGTTLFYRLTLGCLAGFLTCTADAVREQNAANQPS